MPDPKKPEEKPHSSLKRTGSTLALVCAFGAAACTPPAKPPATPQPTAHADEKTPPPKKTKAASVKAKAAKTEKASAPEAPSDDYLMLSCPAPDSTEEHPKLDGFALDYPVKIESTADDATITGKGVAPLPKDYAACQLMPRSALPGADRLSDKGTSAGTPFEVSCTDNLSGQPFKFQPGNASFFKNFEGGGAFTVPDPQPGDPKHMKLIKGFEAGMTCTIKPIEPVKPSR
jgi:hypothetical protein